MDFSFTEEHEELRQTVRRFLENKSDEQVVRGLMTSDQGYSQEIWSQMAEQMALQSLVVPEKYGGAGYGPIEIGIVLEEMGRSLFCAPYLSTAVLAVNTLVAAGSDEAKAEILPSIASGESIATLAVVDEKGGWDIDGITMQAEPAGDSWSLTGTKTYVLDGHVADVILVAARCSDGLGLFRVDGNAGKLSRELLPTLDLTRKLARLRFSGTQATRIDSGGDQTAGLRKALTLTVVALSAEQVGGAQRCLEMSTDYAKTRLQFGRPIGSFQAIKHRCADMLVEVEFAKSAAYHAAFSAAEANDEKEISIAASMAKAYCSEAFFHAAADTIQIHGGMGFTWEHPVHLYFKRAESSALMFGDPTLHREKIATELGI
jgi:alkylation response protein AidB-like acyl-CoA dehydrogenase